jgi:hypothetical protein
MWSSFSGVMASLVKNLFFVHPSDNVLPFLIMGAFISKQVIAPGLYKTRCTQPSKSEELEVLKE